MRHIAALSVACGLLVAACGGSGSGPTDPEQAESLAGDYVEAAYAFDREAVDALPWADSAREVEGEPVDPGLFVLTRTENQDGTLETYSCSLQGEEEIDAAQATIGVEVDAVVSCDVSYSNRVSRLLDYEAVDIVSLGFYEGEILGVGGALGSTPTLDAYLAYTIENYPITDPNGPCITGPTDSPSVLDQRFPYPVECSELWWEGAQAFADEEG